MEKKRNKSKKRTVPFIHYTVRDFYEYDQLSEMNETRMWCLRIFTKLSSIASKLRKKQQTYS